MVCQVTLSEDRSLNHTEASFEQNVNQNVLKTAQTTMIGHIWTFQQKIDLKIAR